MKYLIIGLGNPGVEYKHTRHNVGFSVLDKIASLNKISFVIDRYANVCDLAFKGRKLILVKPNTFMNLSGKAVNYWMQKTKVNLDKILVVTDDISLPFGLLRLRAKGSDGGHNGLKNIQLVLDSKQYARLRFGIGNNFNKSYQKDYVLGNFTHEEEKNLDQRLERAAQIIQSFTINGIDQTMADFNGK